jgi:hypothetical protein
MIMKHWKTAPPIHITLAGIMAAFRGASPASAGPRRPGAPAEAPGSTIDDVHSFVGQFARGG